MFQSTVFKLQATGVIGGLYSDAPRVVKTYILNSSNPANNIYGSAFTKNQIEGFAYAGGAPTSTVSFAGFLVNTKVTPSYGTPSGGPLAPTLVLNNGQIGEFLTRGFIFVFLPAPANVGDYVFYNNTDGTLVTTAPNPPTTPPPAGTSFAHARVAIFNVTVPGLAIIEVLDVPYQEFTTP